MSYIRWFWHWMHRVSEVVVNSENDMLNSVCEWTLLIRVSYALFFSRRLTELQRHETIELNRSLLCLVLHWCWYDAIQSRKRRKFINPVKRSHFYRIKIVQFACGLDTLAPVIFEFFIFRSIRSKSFKGHEWHFSYYGAHAHWN